MYLLIPHLCPTTTDRSNPPSEKQSELSAKESKHRKIRGRHKLLAKLFSQAFTKPLIVELPPTQTGMNARVRKIGFLS